MTTIMDWAWKSALILAVTWSAAFLLRRHSAALRHCIWAMALVGLVVAPAISLKLPTWHSDFAPVMPGRVAAATLPGTTVAIARAPAADTLWELIVWVTGFNLLLARLVLGIAWIQLRARPSPDEAVSLCPRI